VRLQDTTTRHQEGFQHTVIFRRRQVTMSNNLSLRRTDYKSDIAATAAAAVAAAAVATAVIAAVPTAGRLGGLPTGARNTIWTPPCPLPVPDRRDTDWSYDHPSGLYLYSPIPDSIQGAGTSISNVPSSLEGTDVLISRELDFLLSPEDPITLFQTDAEIESPPSSRACPMAPGSPSIWTPESPFTS